MPLPSWFLMLLARLARLARRSADDLPTIDARTSAILYT